MKGKHEKGVGVALEEVRKEAIDGRGERGEERGALEQGRNTDDVGCCLVWSNQATGHNSSR